jgi:hypothetical protein
VMFLFILQVAFVLLSKYTNKERTEMEYFIKYFLSLLLHFIFNVLFNFMFSKIFRFHFVYFKTL